MDIHTWNCVLFVLTHQYKSTFGQSRYDRFDDELTEIPTDIPSKVFIVRIYSNKLTTIKAHTFSQLSWCKGLGLGSNISEIEPGSFNGLGNLEGLVLNDNRLTALRSDMFRVLSKCTTMYLHDNRISEVETGSFNGLSAVRDLKLDRNRLERLHKNMFSSLASCTHLNLRVNLIRVIEPGSFNGLNNVEQLDLRDNRLTAIPADVFVHLPRPLELDISDNRLQCDAALCWLKQEELNGTITWSYFNINKPKCANEVNWDSWNCDDTDNNLWWIWIILASIVVVVVVSVVVIVICIKRFGINIWQKTVPKVAHQRPNRANHENNDDPPGRNVIQNSSFQMESINQAVSMGMVEDSRYTRLQRPSDGYEEPQIAVINSQGYSDYMVPQSNVYEEI